MKGWHKNGSGDTKQFFQVREDLLSWQHTAQENRGPRELYLSSSLATYSIPPASLRLPYYYYCYCDHNYTATGT